MISHHAQVERAATLTHRAALALWREIFPNPEDPRFLYVDIGMADYKKTDSNFMEMTDEGQLELAQTFKLVVTTPDLALMRRLLEAVKDVLSEEGATKRDEGTS